MYVGLLTTAGIPVTLGPMGEPGTAGVIPAPGGVYLFETPEAGVIIYQYRPQPIVVPVPAPEPARESERRFRLQPLTPEQQAALNLTAAELMPIILMVALAPVGI